MLYRLPSLYCRWKPTKKNTVLLWLGLSYNKDILSSHEDRLIHRTSCYVARELLTSLMLYRLPSLYCRWKPTKKIVLLWLGLSYNKDSLSSHEDRLIHWTNCYFVRELLTFLMLYRLPSLYCRWKPTKNTVLLWLGLSYNKDSLSSHEDRLIHWTSCYFARELLTFLMLCRLPSLHCRWKPTKVLFYYDWVYLTIKTVCLRMKTGLFTEQVATSSGSCWPFWCYVVFPLCIVAENQQKYCFTMIALTIKRICRQEG